VLERLKRRLELTDSSRDALLEDLLEDALSAALAYTGRSELPAALEGAVCELAAASFHLLGLEGVSAHAEGSVSESVDGLPPRVRAVLDMYRVGRVM